MAGASFTPDIIWEDSYFDESRPLSRRERVLWIAKNILRSDNCVAKKGEGAWSLRYLSEAWKCPKTTVERFLKKLENLGVIAIRKCKINGTVQYVISYLFSTLSAFSTKVTGTDSGTGAGQERDKKKSRESLKEEDSCRKQAPDESLKPGFRFTDVPPDTATTEPPSPASGAANPEAEPRTSPPPKAPRRSSADCPADLEALWKSSPRMARTRGSKVEAAKVWAKMTAQERLDAAAGVRLWPDNEYAMAVERWLKRKQWISLLETQAAKPANRSYSMA